MMGRVGAGPFAGAIGCFDAAGAASIRSVAAGEAPFETAVVREVCFSQRQSSRLPARCTDDSRRFVGVDYAGPGLARRAGQQVGKRDPATNQHSAKENDHTNRNGRHEEKNYLLGAEPSL